jgi:chromosome segregation ATPase
MPSDNFLGSSFFELSTGNGIERHHILAWNGGKTWDGTIITKDDLPAVQMLKEDHAETVTYRGGLGSPQAEAREKQANLILEGKTGEAWMMDVSHIRDKFGDKYDKAIVEAEKRLLELDVVLKLEEKFKQELLERQKNQVETNEKDVEFKQLETRKEAEKREAESGKQELEKQQVIEQEKAQHKEAVVQSQKEVEQKQADREQQLKEVESKELQIQENKTKQETEQKHIESQKNQIENPDHNTNNINPETATSLKPEQRKEEQFLQSKELYGSKLLTEGEFKEAQIERAHAFSNIKLEVFNSTKPALATVTFEDGREKKMAVNHPDGEWAEAHHNDKDLARKAIADTMSSSEQYEKYCKNETVINFV